MEGVIYNEIQFDFFQVVISPGTTPKQLQPTHISGRNPNLEQNPPSPGTTPKQLQPTHISGRNPNLEQNPPNPGTIPKQQLKPTHISGGNPNQEHNPGTIPKQIPLQPTHIFGGNAPKIGEIWTKMPPPLIDN